MIFCWGHLFIATHNEADQILVPGLSNTRPNAADLADPNNAFAQQSAALWATNKTGKSHLTSPRLVAKAKLPHETFARH